MSDFKFNYNDFILPNLSNNNNNKLIIVILMFQCKLIIADILKFLLSTVNSKIYY